MTIKPNDKFLPKGKTSLDNLFSVREVKGGKVKGAMDGGGQIVSIPMNEFIGAFEPVSEERLSKLRQEYREETVAYDDGEGYAAWVNGERWNGFLIPLFEREAVEAMIAREFPEKGSGGVALFADGDDFVMVSSEFGDDLPAFDKDEILKALGDEYSVETVLKEADGEDHEVQLFRFKPTTIVAGGKSRKTYGIGDSWTWSAVEPAPAPSP